MSYSNTESSQNDENQPKWKMKSWTLKRTGKSSPETPIDENELFCI